MGSIQEVADASLGYDFEDTETRLQMELIDELQKLKLQKYIDLPHLVVVGDQSTGKSSVLQAVTGIPFPVKDTTCTRFATEIRLRRTHSNEKTSIDVSIVPDEDISRERSQHLSEWRPQEFDPNASLTKSSVESILNQATLAIFGDGQRRNLPNRALLSKATLRITRSGPDETNFAIVDLPGLIRGQDRQANDTARYLVEKYLHNKKSIIVVVIDVVDLDRQEIYHMVNNLPEKESRVIGVVNKCDKKDKRSDEWVFDLIRNENSTKSKIYLKEGWYGLRNRQQQEQDISDEERDILELDFFSSGEWKDLDPERLGRNQLKKALIRMRNRHVKKNMPELIGEIQVKLDKCVGQIARLGEPRETNQAQFLLIHRIAAEYSERSKGGLSGRYKDVQEHPALYSRKLILDNLNGFQADMDLRGLSRPFSDAAIDADAIVGKSEKDWAETFMALDAYKFIHDTIVNNRSSYDVTKVNTEVEDVLWKVLSSSWKEIATEALERIEQTIFKVNTKLFENACGDEKLRIRLQKWLQDDFDLASKNAKHELMRILVNETESEIFTLNPLKQAKEQIFFQERIHGISAALKILSPGNEAAQVAQPPTNINPVAVDVLVHGALVKDPELVAVLRTHDSLRAYYDVALNRFIDNFSTQVVERHLLGPKGPLRLFNCDYVSRKLYGTKNKILLEELASEDILIVEERKALKEEMRSLEASKKKVQDFKLS